jgi:hypothetical protein
MIKDETINNTKWESVQDTAVIEDDATRVDIAAVVATKVAVVVVVVVVDDAITVVEDGHKKEPEAADEGNILRHIDHYSL